MKRCFYGGGSNMLLEEVMSKNGKWQMTIVITYDDERDRMSEIARQEAFSKTSGSLHTHIVRAISETLDTLNGGGVDGFKLASITHEPLKVPV